MTGSYIPPVFNAPNIATLDTTAREHQRQANELVRQKQQIHTKAAILLSATEDETTKEILLNVFDADRVMA